MAGVGDRAEVDPLVGRLGELAVLERRLAEARAGAGRLVLVSGPAGIGKTRLVEELAARADVPVAWGAAVDDVGAPPLWPWERALRGLPGPRAALPSATAAAWSPDESAAAEFVAHASVVDALEASARAAGGTLLVLEDLHWADAATLRLLDRLARALRRLPLLVVGTHRDVSTGALAEALPRLHAAPGAEALAVGPLSPEDAHALMSTFAPEADPDLVSAAVTGSGGSPLFLRTVARVGAVAVRQPGGSVELRHLVSAGLAGIGPQAATAVEALSALGVDAETDVLAEVLGDEQGAVLDALLAAAGAGLVQRPEASGRTVGMAHALVREAVYAGLPDPRRRDLHARAAEILEPRAVVDQRRSGEVAHHWVRAGEPGRAAAWAVRAARVAADLGAHAEAAVALRTALDASGPRPSAERAALRLELARAEYVAGHIPEALAACREAADEGERVGDAGVMADAAAVVQGIGHVALNLEVEQLCRRALAALDAERAAGGPDRPAARARVEAQLACALVEVGDLAEATAYAGEALQRARAAGDAQAELDAVRARAAVLAVVGAPAERLELGRRAIELAHPTRRPLAELWGRVWRADAQFQLAHPAAWSAERAAIEALATRTGLPLVRWHALRQQAAHAAFRGDFAEGRERSAESVELADGLHDASARGMHFAFGLCVGLLRADPTELAPGYEAELATAPDIPVIRASRAAAAWLLGDRGTAEAEYAAVLSMLELGLDVRTGPAVGYAAEVAMGLGDEAGCASLARLVGRLSAGVPAFGSGVVHLAGAADRLRGRLDLAAGRVDEAVPLLRSGLRVDVLLGGRPVVAEGRLALARALAASPTEADLTEAAELARDAAAEARRLDLPGTLAGADALLAELDARRRTADPLTTREREIADLVAQALTNRQVADRLVLSERTVESHVRNILAKTGLGSRTELTRWLLRPDGPASRR